MKSILSVTTVALAFAVSSLAANAFEVNPITSEEFNAAQEAAHGDGEIADVLEWQAVVARANAYRMAHELAPKKGDVAAMKSFSASDAAEGHPQATMQNPRNHYWSTGHYHSALEVKEDK